MIHSWAKIENWINQNHPQIIDTLNVGASDQELHLLESTIDQILPEEFKLFLSVHNGQCWTHLKMFDGDRYSSIEDIIRVW